MATAARDGGLDLSPRGDPLGPDFYAEDYDRERAARYARREGLY